MDERFSFAYFLDIIVRRWKLFVGVALLAVVLSSLLSGPAFIRPRYRSMAIVYPVNLTSYSIETRADQLLQLMESNSIRDSLVSKFDLVAHYHIDTTQVSDRHVLYNLYRERVEISKTRYESVQVEVTDEDPVVARDMVQALLDQVNLLARRLQREKSMEVLKIAENSLDNTKAKLADVEQRLDTLRNRSGLLAYDAQTKELTKAYMKLVTSGGSQSQKEAVQQMLNELETKGGEFRSLSDLSNMFRGEYTKALEEYERAVNDMTKQLTYTNVVVYPEIPDKKVYPLRWLIVLASLVASVFLCFLLVAVRDRGMWKPDAR